MTMVSYLGLYFCLIGSWLCNSNVNSEIMDTKTLLFTKCHKIILLCDANIQLDGQNVTH